MKDNRKIRLSSRDYELARLAASISSSGKNNPRYGAIVSEETREKMSIALKGSVAPNKGIPHNNETRRKISEANKGKLKGVKKSEETRRKMSEYQKNNKNRWNKGAVVMNKRKPFSVISPSGDYIEFSGAVEMEAKIGIKRYSINKYLTKGSKCKLGWKDFKFLEKRNLKKDTNV